MAGIKAVMTKPLSLNDKRFEKLHNSVALLYKVNGQLRYFKFNERPRFGKPIGRASLAVKGKTPSEVLIQLNQDLATKVQ